MQTPAIIPPRRRIHVFVSALVLVGLCMVPLSHAQLLNVVWATKHLALGHTLVDQITAAESAGITNGVVDGTTVKLNRYGGSWDTPGNLSFIRFFDAGASDYTGPYAANYTECSPLVTHLLRHAYNWDWKNYFIPDPLNPGKFINRSSPNSVHYVSAIKNHVGIPTIIWNFRALRPGDIGARWVPNTDTTGHTWIVDELDLAGGKAYPALGSPSASDPNFVPKLAGSTYYELKVLDSCRTGHSKDSRAVSIEGVGTGVMGFFVDADGKVLGHTWSLPTSPYLRNGGVNPSWLAAIKTRESAESAFEVWFGRLPPDSM